MFRKIPTQIRIPGPVEGRMEYVKYGQGEDDLFEGIKYTDFIYDTDKDDESFYQFWCLIPPDYRKYFLLSLMSINRDILPHTDSNVRTVLNFYLTAGGYVTSFCSPLAGSQSFKLPTQTDGVVYNFEDVSMDEGFVAKDGDIYLLDVSKLHCVHSGKGNRVALNLGTVLPYNEVVDILTKAED